MGIKTLGKFYTDTETPILVDADEKLKFEHGTTGNSYLKLVNNTDLQIKCPGVYLINFNTTLCSTTGSDVKVYLTANGETVNGAKGSTTFGADSLLDNIAFSTILTVDKCCCEKNVATLAVKVSDDTSYLVTNLIVEKIA